MKQFIKDVLVQMHREATTDKYGQVGTWNFTPRVWLCAERGTSMAYS
jgi:hypothetical protein